MALEQEFTAKELQKRATEKQDLLGSFIPLSIIALSSLWFFIFFTPLFIPCSSIYHTFSLLLFIFFYHFHSLLFDLSYLLFIFFFHFHSYLFNSFVHCSFNLCFFHFLKCGIYYSLLFLYNLLILLALEQNFTARSCEKIVLGKKFQKEELVKLEQQFTGFFPQFDFL